MFPIRIAGGLLKAVSDKLADGSLPIGGVLGQNVVDIANRLPFGLGGKFLGNQNLIGGVVGDNVGSLTDEDAVGNLNPFSNALGPVVTNAVGGGNLFDRLNRAGVTEGRGNLIPFAGESVRNALGETTTDGPYFQPFTDFLSQLKQPREPEDNRRQQPFWEYKKTGGSYSDYLRSILGRRRVEEEEVDRQGRWNRFLPGSFNWPVR